MVTKTIVNHLKPKKKKKKENKTKTEQSKAKQLMDQYFV